MVERATVLFAHGARDPRWARPFERLVEELKGLLPGERVALAFLELMRPSLPDCVAALYADGVRSVRVVPVFFGLGGHLREDLPRIVAELQAAHAGLAIAVDPPIGEQPAVTSAIARAVAQGAR